jgi:ATP-dependent RNA helicase DDX54/DBP10
MPHRAVSPARSENEYDISSALVPHAAEDSDDASSLAEEQESRKVPKPRKSNKARHDPAVLAACIDIDGGDGDSDGDDDDDDFGFIAAQQAASNRKASNLKGRSVKKGGGFQAMGILIPFLHKGALLRKALLFTISSLFFL